MIEEFQGAEATVKVKEDKVVKKRLEKQYRHSSLDDKLRKERTETEQKLLKKADKYGVNVPDTEQTSESTLEMEKIEGKTLKEELENSIDLAEELGENIAKLHSANIIHGDLTTSNAMKSDKVYLIDFGLSFQSERIEDKAVDIHLLKQVFNSSHPEISEDAWKSFVKGYKEYNESEKVLEQLKEVEKRGRYK
jgi:Kae1-associated kinase Bud32